MLSYVEFLLENSLSGYFLKLYLSKNLREILEKSKESKLEGSKVSEFLLNCHNNNKVKSDITFIDITSSNDKVSFIQSSRVKTFYDLNKSDDSLEDWSWEQWDNQEYDILTDVFTKKRDDISVGKFVNKIYKILGKNITSKDLENFVNLYKSSYDSILNPGSRFELVNGEEIRKWYLADNYESKVGELSKSCMRYESCQDYFDIYVDNPKVVSLLILKSLDEKDKIVGRTLVWKTTSNDIIMDRIYTNKESDKNLFYQYAKEKNWKIKDELSISILEKYKIKLENWKFDDYPYLDTFCFLDTTKGILSADDENWENDEKIWKLQETGGGYLQGNLIWVEYSDEFVSRNEVVYCQRRGDWVRESDAIWLEYKGEYAHPYDEIVYSKYSKSSYYEDDAVYSGVLMSYLLSDDSLQIVINSRLVEDFIHKDFEKYLIEIKVDDEDYKTLKIFTMENPITKEVQFKDDIFDYIKNSYEEVSDEELIEYLENVKFDLDDYIKAFSDLQNVIYLYFDKKDLIYLIRSLLITSPTYYVRNERLVLNRLSNSKYFENISDFFKKRFLLFPGLPYKSLQFGESIIDKIIKDPKMLSSYLKKKEIYKSPNRFGR